MAFSARTKFLPLSLRTFSGLPLLLINRRKTLMNDNAVRSSEGSRYTALVVRQVMSTSQHLMCTPLNLVSVGPA
ncbi:unnamed protein product [Meloidogyne enterolobii]|uniref:Uncharacterized protein n=1 Tax=Meloidogyne enterolobii TaxID=390850 RepID=A0ACB0Y8C2_MELEN